jgi:hypothetical protein
MCPKKTLIATCIDIAFLVAPVLTETCEDRRDRDPPLPAYAPRGIATAHYRFHHEGLAGTIWRQLSVMGLHSRETP